ncbi:MAG TPA: hypothetical protein PKJ64_10300, partial [bacterium]|nr:hypothetical protein [bacterium]
ALVSEDRIQIEGNGADRILTINPNRNQSGVALITISVNDGSAITKDTFTIVVQPVNDPVQKIYALRDTSFSEDVSRVFAIRLSEHFGDDDDPVLTYQISPLDSGIRTFVYDDSLFVEGVADSNGTKRLIVEASDGETIANDTVDISLTSQEDAPRLYQTMVDYQMKEDSLTISHRIAIDLKSHFYDPDGDALTFSRNLTDGRGGIQTALSNQTDTLFIWNAVDSNGTFKIAISADDDKGGQKARDTIVLSVFPVNDAPLTSQPVADVFVNENFSKTAIAYLRSTFRDPDGDVLGYGSFTAGGYTDKVTLVTSGDTLYAISKPDSFGVYVGYAKAQDAVTSVADTFRITIKGRPRVTGIQSVSIDTTSFVVNASINPNGTISSLFVRYGRSVEAMNSVSDTSSHSVVETAVHTLHNLIPDSTYFYRVISFSEAGFDSNSIPLSTRTLQVPSEFDQVTVSDPNPSPGTTITITAKVLGSRADSVVLIYGLSKDTIGKRLRMSWNGGLLYSGTIPSASVTINGLWYRVIAYNQRGPKSFPSQGRRQNISIQVSVAAISEIKMVSQFPAGLPENDWSIVSLPVNGSLDLEKYFGKQDMKNGKPTNWSAGTWNTDSNKFISAKILEGGKGYILFHRSKSKNFPFDSIANARTNAPDYFDSIVVHKGWNIIAWPYTYVDTISILAAGFVHNVWTIRDSAGSKVEWTNNSFVMRPYSGFMIKLQNSYPQNTAYLGDLIRRNHKTTVVLSHPNWSIQLAAENDHYRDSKNRIGISESASNGDDGMDGSKPPQFDDRVRLTVRRQEKSGLFENLSSDIRTLTDSGHVWDFEIANAGTGSRFYWISTGIPDNLDAVIVDLTANKAYDIRGNNTVPLIHAEHQFKLIAGNSSFVDQKMKALMETMPTTFSLKQNYPNPFNPTTRIDFDVAHTTHVRIRIYNLLGQEVR